MLLFNCFPQDPYPSGSLKALDQLEVMFQWLATHAANTPSSSTAADAENMVPPSDQAAYQAGRAAASDTGPPPQEGDTKSHDEEVAAAGAAAVAAAAQEERTTSHPRLLPVQVGLMSHARNEHGGFRPVAHAKMQRCPSFRGADSVPELQCVPMIVVLADFCLLCTTGGNAVIHLWASFAWQSGMLCEGQGGALGPAAGQQEAPLTVGDAWLQSLRLAALVCHEPNYHLRARAAVILVGCAPLCTAIDVTRCVKFEK